MTELWEHQQGGIDYLNKNGNWGLLMMGVATGKTRTTLEYIWQKRFKNVLIVGTQKGCRVWKDEYSKLGYPVHTFINEYTDGSLVHRSRIMLQNYKYMDTGNRPQFYIINYEAFARKTFFETLLEMKFDCIIFDEVHRLRGYGTKQSKHAYKIAQANPRASRVGLTGTIIYNRPLDVFGIFRFINPKIFGTNWTKFKYRYAVWGGQFGKYPLYYINQDELKQKVIANSYIVDRHEVLTLPDEQHILRYCNFSSIEEKRYREFNKEFITYLSDKSKITATNVLDKVNKLQQLTSGFVYDSAGTHQFSNAKKEELSILLEEIGDNASVVFYKYKAEKEIIKQVCTEMGKQTFYVNGDENTYPEWCLGGSDAVLIVQVQSGSESIDLTKSGVVIFYSLMYTYGMFEQARGRISRPNSEHKSIVYYYLLVRNSIDEKIYKALQEHKDMVEDLLNGDSYYELSVT